MPIFKVKRWYRQAGIKKPSLQIKILKHIALEGQLSKNMAKEKTGSDYSDVSNAIDSLCQRKMITRSALGMEGRRDRKYYALTGNGLEAFINQNYNTSQKSSTEEFWKAIIWYCIRNPKETSLSEIEKHFYYFEHIYLGHRAVNSYIFQSKFFEKLVGRWIKENCTFDDRIAVFQKILECIAISRRLTIKQLCKISEEEEHDLKEIIDKYAFRTKTTGNNQQQKDVNNFSNQNSKQQDLEYMLIIEKKEGGDINQDTFYELSLFGIMLTIGLIRYCHIGIDGNRFDLNEHNNNIRLRLHFENISMEEYIDKISSNYYDKIPLIFGRWDLLKKELGSFFLYDNFDFMFYDKSFEVNMNTSIWQGGNKEYYDSLQALAERTSTMLKILYAEGRDTLESFIKHKSDGKENELKLLGIHQKITEIKTVLQYLNNEKSSHRPFDEGKKTHKETEKLQDQNLPIDVIAFLEKIFSEEVTFFFYLNLNNDAFVPSRSYSQANKIIKDNPDIIDFDSILVAKDVFSHGSPKDRLTSVLQKDKEIKQNFYDWIEISMNYLKETTFKMIENFKEIGFGNEEDSVIDSRDFQ
jgi:DNA-binding MarR family transcriptional regulator